MKTFIFFYRLPTRYLPTPETSAEMKAWFGEMGEHLVELGQPVLASGTAGTRARDTSEFAGYSIVQAENLAGAVAIAGKCPHLARHGDIEVGELGEVSASDELTDALSSDRS